MGGLTGEHRAILFKTDGIHIISSSSVHVNIHDTWEYILIRQDSHDTVVIY